MPHITCEKCGRVISYSKFDKPPKCVCNKPFFKAEKEKKDVENEPEKTNKWGKAKKIGNNTSDRSEKQFKDEGYEGEK
jgi:hypothetical protein